MTDTAVDIDGLDPAATLDGSERIEVQQGTGANSSRKTTLAAAMALASGAKTGDVLLTVRTPDASWLQLGTIYNQSDYPALYGVVGLLPDGPMGDTFVANAHGVPAAVNNANAVAKINSTTAVVATSSAIYKTVDQGATWQVVTATADTRFWILAMTESIWLMGVAGNVLKRTTDGGATWATVAGITLANFSGQCRVSSTRAFVPVSGGYRMTNDAGATWTTVTVPSNFNGGLMHFTDSTWVLFPQTASATAKRTTDGGATWADVTIAPSQTRMTPASAVIDAKSGIIVCNSQAYCYYTNDAGATWKASTGVTSGSSASSSIIDANTIILIQGGSSGTVYRSTDKGVTWANLGNKGNTDSVKVLIPFTEDYGLQVGSTANVSYSVPGSYLYNTATQFRTPMIVGPMPYSSAIKAYIKA